MSTFIQIHALTFYPPSNLNRDDLGRPKSATVGGVNRLRISSQCLKRTWRTSEMFKTKFEGQLGFRSKLFGVNNIVKILEKANFSNEDANKWATAVMNQFSNVETTKKDKKVQTVATIHLHPKEIEAIDDFVDEIVKKKVTLDSNKKNKKDVFVFTRGQKKTSDLGLRKSCNGIVDIAMFGRMLSNFPQDNMDAAVQVSHAITVNKVHLEDDFFTAVDDLQKDDETGSAHMGETWFGSGVYYLYVCINRDLLLKNLGDDEALLQDALNTLTRAITTLAPSGKQNSFAAHSRCGFVYAEKGSAQPRSLSMAFIKPVSGQDLMTQAVKAFNNTQKQLDEAYEIQNDAKRFYPLATDGEPSDLKTLTELANFVAGPAA